MALLDALRALTSFDPPAELPPCDAAELFDVLDAHGLAPMASYQLESRRIGMSAPAELRERLLPLYQGAVNDNVFKLMTLKGTLRGVDVPVVVLEGAAYLDWLYPHLAFRPVGEPRVAVRGDDGARFLAALAEAGFADAQVGEGGHTAVVSDGRLELRMQEGLVSGKAEDHGLFGRAEPYRALGPTARRPAAEDALLASVADLAALGLHGPLLVLVDLRELLLLPELASADAAARVLRRAGEAGLSRALHGACALVAHVYPQVADRARALSPQLGRVERAAVDAVVESARDVRRLRLPRGAVEAARALVAP